jgi:hypothetical protein
MEKTPVKTPISTGVAIRTAEAVRVLNSSIWFPAVNRKEIHSDVPQLPHRV